MMMLEEPSDMAMNDLSTDFSRVSDSESSGLQNTKKTNLVCPNPISAAMCAIFLPLAACSSPQVVKEKNEKVILSMGKYVGTLRVPGCYVVNPCCLDARDISTAMVSVDLCNVKVADGKGNPLLLSGVVTYRVVDTKRAALDVKSYGQYLQTQGTTVMKKVASMYPYEARDDQPSLKSEAEHLRKDLIRLLQERVDLAGIHVVNFELNDLAYAPEIAAQMLVRQQAEAVVDARKVIAGGAVEIVDLTIKGLETKGVSMTDSQKSLMAANLVVVVCGESSVQNTLSVNNNPTGL